MGGWGSAWVGACCAAEARTCGVGGICLRATAAQPAVGIAISNRSEFAPTRSPHPAHHLPPTLPWSGREGSAPSFPVQRHSPDAGLPICVEAGKVPQVSGQPQKLLLLLLDLQAGGAATHVRVRGGRIAGSSGSPGSEQRFPSARWQASFVALRVLWAARIAGPRAQAHRGGRQPRQRAARRDSLLFPSARWQASFAASYACRSSVGPLLGTVSRRNWRGAAPRWPRWPQHLGVLRLRKQACRHAASDGARAHHGLQAVLPRPPHTLRRVDEVDVAVHKQLEAGRELVGQVAQCLRGGGGGGGVCGVGWGGCVCVGGGAGGG